MEKKNTNNGNYAVKTIIFLLIVGLSCLLFFGLGNKEKTTNELISFGILVFSEFLIFISIIISNIQKDDNMNLLFASILYTLASTILNYVIRLSVIKDLIIWNIAIFMIYLIIVISVSARKK
ncbi:MAG: hypothetical protein IJO43_02805 [Bacilli bacterium]|nr:hypothetical protein [Bacilli bacterium]